MRHVYHCPLRWADLDLLGHVNNAVYVDYLQEARVDMLAVHAPVTGGEELAEGVVVVGHEVEFLAPLGYRTEPVRIESWVSRISAAAFTMRYEILDLADDGTRRVFARAATVLAPYVFAEERPRRLRAPELDVLRRFLEPDPEPTRDPRPARAPASHPPRRHRYACRVRFSDVDVFGHVNNVKYLEYYQEARLVFLQSLGEGYDDSGFSLVVARVDVEYRRPILFRADPYVVETWVVRTGRSSFTLGSEIKDDDLVLSRAETVLVTFDLDARTARALTEVERKLLSASLEGGAG